MANRILGKVRWMDNLPARPSKNLGIVILVVDGTYVDREANVSDNNGSYQFNPNIIHATNGTVVPDPRYSPGNPSMTQSSFASPRQPLTGGFDSGFVAARDPFPGFNYTVVNEQNAVWLYCRKNRIHPRSIAIQAYIE
ncbi:hypothetical protein B0H14DRAFT_3462633 [Mycena olivaceomarginata]|nr:hypothetical protein B0H14DRAFT_3462633 [Mycena olivaceomarginata]